MMPEPATLGLSTALLLGLGFGLGPCNVVCLPYLGPVLFNEAERPWTVLIPFSAGRVLGYVGLGVMAGFLGAWVQEGLEGGPARWVAGLATLGAAWSLWRRRRPSRTPSAGRGVTVAGPTGIAAPPSAGDTLPGSLFLMGLGLALNPCAPLTTLLLGAAATGSPWLGLALGLAFAFGAVAPPALAMGFGLGAFARRLRTGLESWRGGFETASIALLCLMGVATALGWIDP